MLGGCFGDIHVPSHVMTGMFTVNYWNHLWQRYAEFAIGAATRVLVILIVYVIVRFVLLKVLGRLSKSLLSKVGEELLESRQSRIRSLHSALASTVTFILGFLALVMILQAVGLNIVPLITTASVAGLAVGFGAQKLVKDWIAGAFILMEDQYGVGDYVTIGADTTGVVEELGMRITRIRHRSGKLYTIANGDIVQICNHSRGKLRMTQDVAIAAGSDLEKARLVLDEIGDAISRDRPNEILEPFQCEGLAQVTGASVTVRLAGSVVPVAQESIQLDLNSRIRDAFARSEIRLA